MESKNPQGDEPCGFLFRNGYGIKMGESTLGGGHHLIKYCVAWKNKASGFYSYYTGADSTWLNNTSYMNEDRSFNMASRPFIDGVPTAAVAPLTGDNVHVLKNNIAFPNKLSQIGECWYKSETVDECVPCTAGEDLSKIPGILGPRNADGSVPDLDFLKLKEGSRAIDKGEDVGLPFEGAAPDLGAYEYGTPKEGTTFIAKNRGPAAVNSSAATVFDLQGRYLGTLQTKIKTPGVYLVRFGHTVQKMNLK